MNALDKVWNYSKTKNNTELLFKAIPTLSPTFKRRALMDTFGRIETWRELTETPIRKQIRRDSKEAARQKAAVARMDKNLEKQERHFERAGERESKNTDREEHVKNHEMFWTDQEEREINTLNRLLSETQEFLSEHRYEIENQMQAFDWID